MVIPSGYAQVNLKWTGAGVPLGAETTFGVTCAVNARPDEVQVVINQALQGSNFTASLSNQVAISTMLIKVGPTETGPMAEFACNYPGGVGGEPVPPNTAILVKKSTALGGRKAQGRYFLPGAVESSVSAGGIISQEFIADYQEAQDGFLTALTNLNSAMYLLHSKGEADVPPYAVMKLSVQPTVATQRRRLRN